MRYSGQLLESGVFQTASQPQALLSSYEKPSPFLLMAGAFLSNFQIPPFDSPPHRLALREPQTPATAGWAFRIQAPPLVKTM